MCKGGLNQRHVSAKKVRHHFQNVKLYELYKQYIACISDEESDRFYRRPLENGENGELRFSIQPMGVNKSSSLMEDMCVMAGIPGYFSNHYGKRMCATALYQAGVPEQEIMGRTGHRSV